MIWIVFILGMFATWNGIAGEGRGLIGALFQFLFLIVGVSMMVGAMYLRSIGW